MKTIAQELNVTDFPFIIKDKSGKVIYRENSKGYWLKREFDSNGKLIYWEDSNEDWNKREYDSGGNLIYSKNNYGYIEDNRPKGCEGKVVEIDGKKYKLVSE